MTDLKGQLAIYLRGLYANVRAIAQTAITDTFGVAWRGGKWVGSAIWIDNTTIQVNSNNQLYVASGGGGGGGALSKIAQSTVSGSAVASVTFSGIGGTYTHLLLIYAVRATGANSFQQLWLRMNGDTGNNYDYSVWDTGGVANASSQSHIQLGYVAGGSNTAGSAAAGEIVLPGYAQTTLWKVAASHQYEGPGLNRSGANSGHWKSASAVTSLTFLLDANNIDVGSTFSLYGIS